MSTTPLYPTIHQILETVAGHCGITVHDLLSHRRQVCVARPRQMAYWLAYRLTLHTLPTIGRHFSDRDHTTVLHGIRVIERLMASSPSFARDIRGLAERLAPAIAAETFGALA